jgi:hypothetical protein
MFACHYPSLNVSQDRRIAHMPYHALTASERETYNARRKLLAHMGDILRIKAVDREKRRLIEEDERGVRSKDLFQMKRKKKVKYVFILFFFILKYGCPLDKAETVPNPVVSLFQRVNCSWKKHFVLTSEVCSFQRWS